MAPPTSGVASASSADVPAQSCTIPRSNCHEMSESIDIGNSAHLSLCHHLRGFTTPFPPPFDRNLLPPPIGPRARVEPHLLCITRHLRPLHLVQTDGPDNVGGVP